MPHSDRPEISYLAPPPTKDSDHAYRNAFIEKNYDHLRPLPRFNNHYISAQNQEVASPQMPHAEHDRRTQGVPPRTENQNDGSREALTVGGLYASLGAFGFLLLL